MLGEAYFLCDHLCGPFQFLFVAFSIWEDSSYVILHFFFFVCHWKGARSPNQEVSGSILVDK